MKKNKLAGLVDKLGICLSFTCGLHCLITIALLAFGSLKLHAMFESELLETVVSLGVLIVGAIAFIPRLIVTRNFYLPLIFTVGFILLKMSESMDLWVQIPMLVIGVFMIILAHFKNIKDKTVKT
ncbi:MAG: MerC domain-containing protein [Bacteroidota bacterium]